MTTYNQLAGLRVNYLGSDPTLNTGNEGQVWYNSTSGTLKSLVQIKAWSAGGNLTTARRSAARMGTQTAGAIAGGQISPAYTNATEEYSGYTWAAGGNLNTTRAFLAGAGTQTSGLAMGGEQPGGGDLTSTEKYDGTSWTNNPTGLNNARRDLAGCGLQTAALAFGGTSTPTARTESFNGTTWTAVNSLNTGRSGLAGTGTQTAALAIGGPSAVVESWNGTSWTNGPSLVTQIDGSNAAGGVQTNAITFGGSVPPGVTLTAVTQQYDGSAWATVPSLATARRELMGMGTAQAALAAGGFTPPTFSAATEEFNSSINAITDSSWAAGGSLNTARGYLGGFGSSQTASIAMGGFAGGPYPSTILANTESYNGTSWTNVNNLNTGRNGLRGLGTQASGLGVGGYIPANPTGNPFSAKTEEWDGTNWSNTTDLPAATNELGSCGTQTAGLSAKSPVGTLYYNGSTWSTEPASFPLSSAALTGTQTAALAFNGTDTLSYNGTTWTNLSKSFNSPRSVAASSGTQTASLGSGGPPASTDVEEWNGTSWSVQKPLSTGRRQGAGAGVITSALVFGGYTTVAQSATEEYTQGSSITRASTLTTS